MASAAPPPDDVSLVVVLLDTTLHLWDSISKSVSGLQQVLAFLNSTMIVNHLNHLVVIATGSNSCEFIYDSSNTSTEIQVTVSQQIMEALKAFMSKDAQVPRFQTCLLSASLSMALCYIQRILRRNPPHPKPRILCIQGSPDGSQQYISVMNAIFSAQRSMVPIDACVVGAQHSAFLQQACDITGGIYMMPPHIESLIQYLLTIYAVDLHSRQFVRLPRASGVDLRASCFCHKRTIDKGYICSVCLSIFCDYRRECSTCGTSFVGRTGQKRKTPTS